jgi:hypothetical protein
MDKPTWEQEFCHQLQKVLSLNPANIRSPSVNFRIQGYSPSEAIAYLIQTHRLYPELELLPMPPPKFGIGQTVVRQANGNRDRINAMRWTRSTYYYWAYQVEGGFGRNPNAWFAERILESVTETAQENFAAVL